MNIRFNLRRHTYTLTMSNRYCGAIVWNRHPRSGEDWLRGNDLRDGKLWRLPAVLWDIVQYEFRFGRWAL